MGLNIAWNKPFAMTIPDFTAVCPCGKLLSDIDNPIVIDPDIGGNPFIQYLV
ncbi:Uncharacterised protein [Mycobacteroides abscessus subsp. abscessus]|nr:Uncharacterised protein [Mycobacteroides abscessus subsp. abscessus]